MKDIKSVSLVDRRGYLTVALEIGALIQQLFWIINYIYLDIIENENLNEYSDDCISFFRWWDGRAGAAEAGGSPWLVQPRAEAGQCDIEWHYNTSVSLIRVA